MVRGSDEDPYVILNVSRNATIYDINEAYKNKLRSLHPDTARTGHDHDRCVREMSRVRRAHQILKDPYKRRILDTPDEPRVEDPSFTFKYTKEDLEYMGMYREFGNQSASEWLDQQRRSKNMHPGDKSKYKAPKSTASSMTRMKSNTNLRAFFAKSMIFPVVGYILAYWRYRKIQEITFTAEDEKVALLELRHALREQNEK